jgi:transposase
METKLNQNGQVRFIPYEKSSVVNLEVDAEVLFGPGHLVRIVSGFIDSIPISTLEKFYSGGGRSSYDPRMMLNVWLYGYCTGVYTSRTLARAMRESLPFIWLSGGMRPCFRTLAGFRSKRMQTMIDDVFTALMLMLIEQGYVDLSDLYVDGTKVEANCNVHKIVWKKSILGYKEAVLARIKALLQHIRSLQKVEDQQYGSRDFPEVGEGKNTESVLNSMEAQNYLQQVCLDIEQAGMMAQQKRELQQAAKKLDKEIAKLRKYEKQEQILAGRNSYTKTDLDACGMMLKDGRLHPAYNVSVSTQNQFILNYNISNNANDTIDFVPHMKRLGCRLESIGLLAQPNVCADAAYGSEENYAYLEKNNMAAYLKFPLWYREKTGQLAKEIFRSESWRYDADNDRFTCPNGRDVVFTHESRTINQSNYEIVRRHYACTDCSDCPLAKECKHESEKARTVQKSVKGEYYKEVARQNLESTKGLKMRSQRGVDVEPVFGDIKYNMHHRRFLLRSMPKVFVEYGLLALSHNLRKISCLLSGIWDNYYAQRRAKKPKKGFIISIFVLGRSTERHRTKIRKCA